MSEAELEFRPHSHANNAAATVWHLGRWFDFLANRRIHGAPERWYRDGWADRTRYDPEGICFPGLGTLTGYSVEEMLAVPPFGAEALRSYVQGMIGDLVVVGSMAAEELHPPGPAGLPSAFQAVGSTIRGSFGHIREIDWLVSHFHRVTA